MKKWKACATFYGPEQSSYCMDYIEIPDDMYDDLIALVSKKIPINEYKHYKKLKRLAEDFFDVEKWFEYDEEEPERDDYDDDDEYEEALEEYNDDKENFYDKWCLEDLALDDPGAIPRLLDMYKGRKVNEDYSEEGTYEETLDQGECGENHCYVTFSVDKNGCLEDISVYAEGLESEGERSSEWSECLPDYIVVEDFLEEITDLEDED